ncbi:MAG: deiodinase-like protein [Tepidisphaeraceae bacterium]|jgi:Spy/CpxP family protein refolding chaperone
MRRVGGIFAFVALIGVAIGSPARGQEAASRSSTRPELLAPGLMFALGRIRTVVGQMDLSADQKTKVDQILEDEQQQADQLAESMAGMGPQDRGARVVPFLMAVRRRLAEVLTPDQMQSLVGQIGGANGGRIGGGGGIGPLRSLQQELAQLDLTADQKQKVDDLLGTVLPQLESLRQKALAGSNVLPDTEALRQQTASKLRDILTPDQFAQLVQDYQDRPVGSGPPPVAAESAKPAATTQASYPDVGQPARDFAIYDLSAHSFSLAEVKGRVTVIEFGSISQPTFRDHVKQMENLRSRYGGRVNFLLVYTREAHPMGGWEVQRNHDDNINVDDPTDIRGRIDRAQQTIESLGIHMTGAVDSMKNSMADSYGLFPNGALVLDKDGTIVLRQQWVDPFGLQQSLDGLVGETN